MSEWRRIGEMEAARGTTHLLASTLVRGQTFQVMRTPSMPSGSMFAISAIGSDRIGSVIELWRRGVRGSYELWLEWEEGRKVINPWVRFDWLDDDDDGSVVCVPVWFGSKFFFFFYLLWNMDIYLLNKNKLISEIW